MYLRGFQFAELAVGESLSSPTVCDHCGREELKRTVKLINPEGRVVWFGAGCAANAMGVGIKVVNAAKREAEAERAEADRIERAASSRAEFAQWQAFLDRQVPALRGDTFRQIESLGGGARARTLFKQALNPNARKTTTMPRRPARATAKPKSDTITEEDVQAAFNVINKDYWNDVRGIAEDLYRELRSGELSRDDIDERIHELVEGSARVIYTFQAKLGMLCTNNADAYEELGVDLSEGIDWSKLMACSMIEDVRSHLTEEGEGDW